MTAADTFAAFVDHLSDALDQSEVGSMSGEEWAARLHFSRFHFDRIIAHVLTFAAHRRTLVSLALMRLGLDELGWGDPMLWVAAERA